MTRTAGADRSLYIQEACDVTYALVNFVTAWGKGAMNRLVSPLTPGVGSLTLTGHSILFWARIYMNGAGLLQARILSPNLRWMAD